MRSKIRWSLSLLALVSIASVLIAPRESSESQKALLTGARIDSHAREVLERCCRDCHSEATRYPWYSYVAPVSWWIQRDVSQGRLHLNLSNWEGYSSIRKQRSLSEIANQVKDREMPLREYVWLHPSAKLSPLDVDAVFLWTQAERARLIAESQH